MKNSNAANCPPSKKEESFLLLGDKFKEIQKHIGENKEYYKGVYSKIKCVCKENYPGGKKLFAAN